MAAAKADRVSTPPPVSVRVCATSSAARVSVPAPASLALLGVPLTWQR